MLWDTPDRRASGEEERRKWLKLTRGRILSQATRGAGPNLYSAGSRDHLAIAGPCHWPHIWWIPCWALQEAGAGSFPLQSLAHPPGGSGPPLPALHRDPSSPPPHSGAGLPLLKPYTSDRGLDLAKIQTET